LPPVADYFPPASGKYDVRPALLPFGSDFGNRDADQQVFQLDEQFPRYRATKLAARRERLSKYYRTHMLSTEVSGSVLRFIIERLSLEHPESFSLQGHSGRMLALHCQLTDETLIFDDRMRLVDVQRSARSDLPSPDYHDALDALACQVQEDIVVVSKSPFGRDWLAAIHLCMANQWSAEDKIGQPFRETHAPVPGMRNEQQDADKLVNAIINKGPFVRFAWGLTSDENLNHHPRPASSMADAGGAANDFDPAQPQLYLRIERQTLWPFTTQQAALFTIRTYLTDCNGIRQDAERNSQLISALRSMSSEQLRYKGIEQAQRNILQWLVGGRMRSDPSRLLRHAIRHLLQRQ
jgi:hypothetical protein